MNQNNDVPFTQWAVINQTEKFTVTLQLSGYRRHLYEDQTHPIYLDPNPTEETLGSALLESLNISRFVDPWKEGDFFSADRIVASDKAWHAEFMKRFRYKTLREAYKNMLYCLAQRSEGRIAIRPHRRGDKPRFWWDLPPEQTVVIPATDDPGILGAAAKLALSRCE